jgi:hypothetical protein
MICVIIVLEVKEYVACTWEMGNAYNILVVKPEIKRPPGRTRHRQDDIIEVDLKAVWFGAKYELGSVAQDRVH